MLKVLKGNIILQKLQKLSQYLKIVILYWKKAK